MTRRHWRGVSRVLRGLAVIVCAGAQLLTTSVVSCAEPNGGDPSSPFPAAYFILRYYDKVKYDDYFTRSSGGVWFSTPLGLNCGIWDRGSFGCSGNIPGAPPGTKNVGWVTGNIAVRYDWLLGVQFPPGVAERELAPHTYIDYNGTTCATMADSGVFCAHGQFRFLATPTRTWLSPS